MAQEGLVLGDYGGDIAARSFDTDFHVLVFGTER
jgi:hypothetical protein